MNTTKLFFNIIRALSLIALIAVLRGITIMNTTKLFFNITRALSFIALIAVLSMGFFMPISISQALIVNPLLLVALGALFVYCGVKLGSITVAADIEPCHFSQALHHR
jgi:hypothetical protein